MANVLEFNKEELKWEEVREKYKKDYHLFVKRREDEEKVVHIKMYDNRERM